MRKVTKLSKLERRIYSRTRERTISSITRQHTSMCHHPLQFLSTYAARLLLPISTPTKTLFLYTKPTQFVTADYSLRIILSCSCLSVTEEAKPRRHRRNVACQRCMARSRDSVEHVSEFKFSFSLLYPAAIPPVLHLRIRSLAHACPLSPRRPCSLRGIPRHHRWSVPP